MYCLVKGAEALYLAIFGYENRWGKLPVTIYPADFINQQSMFSFGIRKDETKANYFDGSRYDNTAWTNLQILH